MKFLKAALPAVALLAIGTATIAAVDAPSQAPAMQQHGTTNMQGTPGMMGQMDPAQMEQMMDRCQKMMGSRGDARPPAADQQPKG